MASAWLTVERLEDRTAPANFGVPWPDPQHLTLSFVPDHTPAQSTLFQVLSGQEPTVAWQTAILQAFQTWAIQANINVGLVPDGGQVFGTPGPPQGDPRFGDIRIGTNSQLMPDAVAVALPFDIAAGNWSGDVKLNPLYTFGIGTSPGWVTRGPYDLFTVFLHEAGHVLGLDHSSDPASAMYESFSGTRLGLSSEDITRLQALYGIRQADSFDARSPNDDFTTATRISPATGPITADLTTLQDVDVYQFTTTHLMGGTVSIRLQTAGLSLLQARLTVYDSAHQPIAAQVASSPLNGDLEIQLNHVRPASVYYIQVAAGPDSVFGIGSYRLELHSDATGHHGQDVGPHAPALGTSAQAPLNLQPRFYRTDARFNYTFQGSLDNAAAVNYFSFRAPSPRDGTASVLTGMVWGIQPGGLAPQITLFDAQLQPLPAEVLVNENGTFTIQMGNATPAEEYLLAVRAADPSNPQQYGPYFLGIDFGTRPEGLQDIVSDAVLDAAQPEGEGTLYVSESQLFHLVLSAAAGSTPTSAAVQMTVTDDEGQTLLTLTTRAGDAQSATFVLQPGEYEISFRLRDFDGTPLTYSLRGLGLSDPIGPESLDTTLNPVGSTSGAPAAGETVYWWETGFFQFLTLSSSLSVSPVGPTAQGNSLPPAIPGTTPFNSSVVEVPQPAPADNSTRPVQTAIAAVPADRTPSVPPANPVAVEGSPSEARGDGLTIRPTSAAVPAPVVSARPAVNPAPDVLGSVLTFSGLPGAGSAVGETGVSVEGTLNRSAANAARAPLTSPTYLVDTAIRQLPAAEAVSSGIGWESANLPQTVAANDSRPATAYRPDQQRGFGEVGPGRLEPAGIIRGAISGMGRPGPAEGSWLDGARVGGPTSGQGLGTRRGGNGCAPRPVSVSAFDGLPIDWQGSVSWQPWVAGSRRDPAEVEAAAQEAEPGAPVTPLQPQREFGQGPVEVLFIPVYLLLALLVIHSLHSAASDDATRSGPRL